LTSQAILIVTWYGTVKYCLELLKSLENYKDYPLVVAINESEKLTDPEFLEYLQSHPIEVIPIAGNRWECGGLMAASVFSPYQEFILIQDTLEVKDPSIFNQMFAYEGRSVAFGDGWLCYLGKYRRDVLNQVIIPTCLTKMEAFYHEVKFGALYNWVAKHVEGQDPVVMFPEWHNDNPNNWIEERFERQNLVLDNPYLIKRKSLHWKGAGPFQGAIAWEESPTKASEEG
jgi:hypothetical protein